MRVWHPRAPALRQQEGFLVEKRPPFLVGRGPVPRRASVYRTFAGDRPPRYGTGRVLSRKNGPLPRRARACPSQVFTRAGERVSLAKRLAVRLHSPCRSGSPDPDPFGIGRSRTTVWKHRDQEVSPTGTSLASRPGGRARNCHQMIFLA